MMTKKKQVMLIESKCWNQISKKLISNYSSTHKVKKSFEVHATTIMYIVYDILYKMSNERALDYRGINYQALKKWSMMGNQFCSFFKYLLQQKVVQRKESTRINPKTNRPYTIFSEGLNSQYRINPKLLKHIQNDEVITLTLQISQKNRFFFPVQNSCEKKLQYWRKKDDYNDYREPNQYQKLVMNRLKNLTGRINPTFVHGRIYSNDWTNLSKEDRKLVKFEGKEIAQVFDIHNCFIQLLANKLNESGVIEKQELDKFSKLAYSGKFYQSIVEGTKYTRDDIKQKVMHFIFSNNWTKTHTIANQKKFVNGVATKRFDQEYIKQWQLVKQFFKSNYSSIFSYMTAYQEVQIDGRKKSKLSVDLQWMQNKYMLNGLMKGLEQRGIIKQPISLHDAIYLTKEQVTTELKVLIENQWLKLVGHANLAKTPVKLKANSEREIIRNWLVETNTSKEHMKQFDEEQNLYSLFKIAYEYGTGKIKSTREVLG